MGLWPLARHVTWNLKSLGVSSVLKIFGRPEDHSTFKVSLV